VVAFRLITILLLAYLVFAVIYSLWSSIKTTRMRENRIRRDQAEELVPCIQCQSYLPKAEAILHHGHYFCREECARLFEKTA
jgi:hypothetical protein